MSWKKALKNVQRSERNVKRSSKKLRSLFIRTLRGDIQAANSLRGEVKRFYDETDELHRSAFYLSLEAGTVLAKQVTNGEEEE